MRNIYRKIAKAHGVSVAKVRRDMQTAVDDAHENRGQSKGGALYLVRIPFTGKAPAKEEFLVYIPTKIKKKKS